MFTSNPYALLSEDSVPSAAPAKKQATPAPPMRKVQEEKKEQAPRRDQRSTNTRGRGRGGVCDFT
jgi:hypothetical protein